MDRNEARALWAASGLDYSILTETSLQHLINLIDVEMLKSGLILGSYRMEEGITPAPQKRRGNEAYLRCRSDHFRGREAVSFNQDGFVGFAGWADDQNIVPVLKGFAAWVEEMRTTSAQHQAEASHAP